MNRVFDIDFKSGNVMYAERGLRGDLSLDEQLDNLREDLLQVEFKSHALLLDVGWYPEGDEDGSFVISIVKNYDWSSPIFKSEADDLLQLSEILCKAVEIAENSN